MLALVLQAGRFYAERSAAKKRAQFLASHPPSSSDPISNLAEKVDDATTPIPASGEYSSGSLGVGSNGSATGKKTRRRAQTPYREMTEAELLEVQEKERSSK